MLKPGAEWGDCVDLYEAEAARQMTVGVSLKKKKRGGPAVYVGGVQPIETDSNVSVTSQVKKELSSRIILM